MCVDRDEKGHLTKSTFTSLRQNYKQQKNVNNAQTTT